MSPFFLLLFLFSFCKNEQEILPPLRVRYQNQTDMQLTGVQAALLDGDGYTKVGTIGPGDSSEWVSADSLVLYSTGPYHFLEGQTAIKPFTAAAFHDCLTGSKPDVRYSGNYTFIIRPWAFLWTEDTSKIHLELMLEQ